KHLFFYINTFFFKFGKVNLFLFTNFLLFTIFMLKIKVNSNFYYNLIKKYTFDTCSLLFYKIVPRLYGVNVSISHSPKKHESPADIWYRLGLATHLINN